MQTTPIHNIPKTHSTIFSIPCERNFNRRVFIFRTFHLVPIIATLICPIIPHIILEIAKTVSSIFQSPLVARTCFFKKGQQLVITTTCQSIFALAIVTRSFTIFRINLNHTTCFQLTKTRHLSLSRHSGGAANQNNDSNKPFVPQFGIK